MENYRNFESLWLFNLNIIMTEFVSRKNSTLYDVYKSLANNKLTEVKNGIEMHLIHSIATSTFELLTLATENFKREGMNFSNREINNILNKIKQYLSPEFRSVNGEEFLKLIRSSVAHNSESNQNLKSNTYNKYKINWQKKGISAPQNSSFTYADVVKILEAYDHSRILEHPHAVLDLGSENKTADDILKANKKLGSLSNFIKYYNYKGEEVPIDKYQEKAFIRFLIKHKETLNKLKNPIYYISRFFPAQENKLNLYEYKYQLFTGFDILLDNYENFTCQDMLKIFKANNLKGAILPFTDKEIMKSIIYSSIAFNIFSSRTNNELYNLILKAEVDIKEEDVRHLRNSFMHGRYYYNFNNGFELYDGTNEMTHIMTFGFDQLEKIYEAFAEEQKKEVIIRRAIYLKDKLFEEEKE